MIIHESKTTKYLLFLFLLFAVPAFCQKLEPAPDFLLLDAGYGSAALGMGGAFTAVASDLSAIYWNPAGVAALPGMQFAADYRHMGDSDEDFGAEVAPNRFDSRQRFSISGNQYHAFAVSYTFRTARHTFVPMFAWQRPSLSTPERKLKETAGLVDFETQRIFLQSEGDFQERTSSGDNELAFGMASMVTRNILIGGTWNFLTGSPKTTLTGTFHDTFVNNSGTQRQDIDLIQTRKENLSGNYLKFGALFFPRQAVSFGATVRFPYTRKGAISLDRRATITTETGTQALDITATATSELKVPVEWSAGVAFRRIPGVTLAGSVTYANWDGAERVISDSSDTALLPETGLPFPTLRAAAGPANSLLQLRAGTEYITGKTGYGLALRTGIFRDGQPYSTKDGQRAKFKGYSFGVGYIARGFRFDAAFIREKGDIFFTPFSRESSSFSQRRLQFTLTLSSQ